MKSLYQGFGKMPEVYEHGGYMASNEEEKESNFLRYLDDLKEGASSSQNIFSKNSKKMKIFNNFIVMISDDHYGEFLEKNRESTYKDCTIVFNHNYKLEACSAILRYKSSFFDNMMSKKFKSKNNEKLYEVNTPGNIVLLEILINFLMHNFLIVPESMTWKSWI